MSVILDVPYVRQCSSYHCGPASAEMFFKFYGIDVGQEQIGKDVHERFGYDLTDKTREDPGLKFFHLKEVMSLYMEHISGTTNMSAQDILELLDNNNPIMARVSTDDGSHPNYAHFIVIRGYEDNILHIHDPWYMFRRVETWENFLKDWDVSQHMNPTCNYGIHI